MDRLVVDQVEERLLQPTSSRIPMQHCVIVLVIRLEAASASGIQR